jgi:hypothetical protein
MSMSRIDQYPGCGSGSSRRLQTTPARVTTAAASHVITPTTKTHGVDPDETTMTPTMATASPRTPLEGPRPPSCAGLVRLPSS